MSLNSVPRRAFLAAGAALLAAAPALARAADGLISADAALDGKLDPYVAQYMKAMNAPGMTLSLTDRDRTLRVAGFGLADLGRQLPVTPAHLFQIGSITKSFVALVLLQLRDEARLDLDRPVLDYLPWLPIDEAYGPITVHHLLTHSSGLPDSQSLFLSDPDARHVQGFAPGAHFHYCNLGFSILGQLVATLDRRPWHAAATARILTPLGMSDTVPVLTDASRARQAVGYEPLLDDQVYPRQGALAPSGNLVMDDTAGCIAATPADMARYLRMLALGGEGPNGRIVSAESFALFSKAHIKADEFGPTASYGYGIAVDTLDGHRVLRHTGGMIAFASSIHVDLDTGVGAFASINAMQGYRPVPVTQYAVRLLRARAEGKPLPAAAAIADAEEIADAADYAGVYTAADGTGLTIQATGKRLSLVHGGESIPLQRDKGDQFVSTLPGRFAEYPLSFGRVPAPKGGKDAKPGAVVELGYGPLWLTNPAYAGPREFPARPELAACVGQYRSESAWVGDVRVYLRKGTLFVADGPAVALGDGLFRIGDDDWSPDRAEFRRIVDGKARLLKLVGCDCWRVELG